MLSVIPQVMIKHDTGIGDWQSLRATVLQVSGVVDAAPFVELGGMMFVDSRNAQYVALYGVDPDYEPTVSAVENFLGQQSLQQLNTEAGVRGVFLGHALAENLRVKPGGAVKIIIPQSGQVEGFTVLGIFATGTEVDNALALTSIPIAQSLSPWPDKVTGLRLKIDDVFLASSIGNFITRQVLQEPGYYADSWTRQYSNLYYAIRQSKSLVELLLSLIIGIAAFNLVSTLVMVVVDKQGDIAILRTLGASTQKIMGVFMVQGSFIGVIGTGLGLLIGIPLAYGIEDIVQYVEKLFGFQLLKSDSYPISFVPTDPLFADIAYITVMAMLLSLLATIYPAWRASRVKPAEALRFEI